MSASVEVGVAAAFGAGIVSFISPCIAPLLPGYLTLISGAAGQDRATMVTPTRLRLFWPSVIFVAGFTLVFVSLGASASAFGNLLQVHQRDLAKIAGAVMILMGLVVLWGTRAPFLMRERRFHMAPRAFTSSEVLLLGMAFGFGWTPCVGPILASILVYTSTAETVREGTLLLTAYSLGLGLPFLLAGLGLGQFRQLVRAIGRHSRAVVAVSGTTLVVLGVLFVTGQMFQIAVAGERLLANWRG